MGIRERNTAVFYTCGVCNLQCRYCGIDKNPVLKAVDEALGRSFEGDYYFEQVKKYFPHRDTLKRIETWGGEPFLKMDRIYPLLHQVINHYPYFEEMMSSTNFSYDAWIDQFFGLMEQFGQHPYRDFTYFLQLSCDGPGYINDAGRGFGVTAKCLKIFNQLLEELPKRLPENVTLIMYLKGTLDNESIRQLCDKQKLIEYYQWIEEEFLDKANKLNMPNVQMGPTVPNTAVPSPVTKEEGKVFAELCRICREIESENHQNNYFKYYNEITPMTTTVCQEMLTYKYSHHNCGTGSSMLGFLPDGMISTCHAGFSHFIDEYKKAAASSNRVNTSTITFDDFVAEQPIKFCVDEKGFEEFERHMSLFNTEGTTARVGMLTNIIMSLALAGQIDEAFFQERSVACYFLRSYIKYSFLGYDFVCLFIEFVGWQTVSV